MYPTTVGGVGILLYHTVRALLTQGMRVILYLDLSREEIRNFDQRDRHDYPNPHLLEYYDVRAMRDDLHYCEELYGDREQWRSVSFAHAILKTQSQHDIDLIEFYDYCGPAFHYLSFGATRRKPVAIRLHNTTELIERGTRVPFRQDRVHVFAMERCQLMLADIVLSPGPIFYNDEILPLYGTELKHQLIANATPIHESIGKADYSKASRKVLFYGRLSTFKGLDTFINGAVLALRSPAFSKWLDEFVIAGPEETVASALSLEEMLSVIPDEWSHKFRLAGRLTHPQLFRQLSDVAFACFSNRMESFCYAAHELHSAGIPLVIADRPAFRDHFSPEEVLFFDGTGRGLALAMTSLAADQESRSSASMRAAAKLPECGVGQYLDFAEQAARRLAAAAAAAAPASDTHLSIIILSNGDTTAEVRTRVSLGPLGELSYTLAIDAGGGIAFAGSRWSLQDQRDPLGDIGTACLFLRAGDICYPEVILEAARDLAADDRIGAIALWCEVGGRIKCAPYAFIPEHSPYFGPGLRTLIRVTAGLTFIELLRSGSSTDEMSLLLFQRAQSRGLVERPEVGVIIDCAVPLPAQAEDAGVDYDRMTNTYLALSRGLLLSAADGARRWQKSGNSDNGRFSLLSIRPSKDFGNGEMWVLRIFRRRGAVHEPWSCTHQTGEWIAVVEPQSPAGGALKTYDGELSFWADNNYGMELLWGPFCSGAEIRFRDAVYNVQLRADNVTSSIIWLDELVRGVAQLPVAGCLPIVPVGRNSISASSKSWILSNIKSDTTKFLLVGSILPYQYVEPRSAVVTAETILGTARISSTDLALCIDEVLVHAPNCSIHIDFELDVGPAPVELLLISRDISIVLEFNDQALSQRDQGIYRRLARWAGTITTWSNRLVVTGDNDDLLFALLHAGARIERTTYALPRCRPTFDLASAAEVDIIILNGGGIIDGVGHMVAGAAFLSMLGVRVTTLYLHDQHWHDALVSETLSAAKTCVAYRSFEQVLALPRHRPLIACAVYPDPVVPREAVKAIALGVPTLIGPVGLSKRYAQALGVTSVAYWEDAQDIGQKLLYLSQNLASVMSEYNAAVQLMERQQTRSSSLVPAALTQLAAAATWSVRN